MHKLCACSVQYGTEIEEGWNLGSRMETEMEVGGSKLEIGRKEMA